MVHIVVVLNKQRGVTASLRIEDVPIHVTCVISWEDIFDALAVSSLGVNIKVSDKSGLHIVSLEQAQNIILKYNLTECRYATTMWCTACDSSIDADDVIFAKFIDGEICHEGCNR